MLHEPAPLSLVLYNACYGWLIAIAGRHTCKQRDC